MAEDPYVALIRESLKKPGKTQSGLAEHLGVDKSAVSKILSGKRRLASHEIVKAAEYLGEAPPNFTSEVTLQPTVMRHAQLAGKVEAGAFREVDDFDQREPETILVPADREFPSARILLFQVEGDSMNALKPTPILPGYQVVALAFEDISDRVPLRDGMIVVVQRTRDGGHVREWSIKQIEYYADRIEFHPRSNNGKHRPIVVFHDRGADDGTTVEIIALVRGAQVSF